MSIGSRIKEARLEKELTQEDLARMLGVTKGAIANYENQVSVPKLDILLRLMDLLGCDANYIYQDEMHQPKNGSQLKTKSEPALTPPELEHIKKYRTLDGHGKRTVDVVLEEEVQRMEEMRKAEEKKVLKPKEAQEPEDKVVIPFMRNRASAGGGVSLEDDDYVPIVLDRTYETSKADYAVRVTGSSMEPKYFDGDILLIRKQPSVDVGQIGIFTINDEGYVKKQGADRLISVNPDYDDIYPSPDDDVRCCGLVLGKL